MTYRQALIKLLRDYFGDAGPRMGAEIGVHRGATSASLLNAFRQLTLWMVDPWRAPHPESPYYQTGDPCARATREEFEEHYRTALRNVAHWPGRRRVLRKTSREVAIDLRESLPEFDFVFIDGDHSYDGCLRSLRDWWSHVGDGGLLVMHDYGKTDHAVGVTAAADEFALEASRPLFERDGFDHLAWLIK